VYSSTGTSGLVDQVSVTRRCVESERGLTWMVAAVGAPTSYLNSQPTRSLIKAPVVGMAQKL